MSLSPYKENNKHCQRGLLDACDPGDPDQHVGSDVLQHLDWGITSPATVATWELGQRLQHVWDLPVRSSLPCVRHGCECLFRSCDLDASGFPCTDFSPAGKQAGIAGVTIPVLLSLLKFHRVSGTKMVLLENVPEFSTEIVVRLMQDLYDIQEFFMEPADIGACHLSRMRVFILLVLRGWGGLLQ